MVQGMISLLKNCPQEVAHLRRELLIVARHILATDLRNRFVTCIDQLFDENLLIGEPIVQCWNFVVEGLNFCQHSWKFLLYSIAWKFYPVKFFVNDYIEPMEPMAIFTVWTKIHSTLYKGSWVGQHFCQENIFGRMVQSHVVWFYRYHILVALV